MNVLWKKKSPPRYVVSIVNLDYSKITYISYFTFLCIWLIDNLQMSNKVEFYKKYRYIFFYKKWNILYSIKFDPIVGNCVFYIA